MLPSRITTQCSDVTIGFDLYLQLKIIGKYVSLNIHFCPSLRFYYCDEHQGHKKLGEQRIFFILQSTIRERLSKDRNSRNKLEAETMAE